MTALYVAEGARIYEDFVSHLDLPGWEEQSIWGFDTGAMSLFAQLYHNGADPDEPPTIWLVGVDPVYGNIVDLRDAIAAAARCNTAAVSTALTPLHS